MKRVSYEVLDPHHAVESASWWRRLTRSGRQLLWPGERPRLSILHFSTTLGLIWAALVLLFTFLSRAAPLSIIDYFNTIYPGYTLPAFPALEDLLIQGALGLILGFGHGFLFGFVTALVYNAMGRRPFCDVLLKKRLPRGEPVILINRADGGKYIPEKEPFTIVILANPFLETATHPPAFKRDPILDLPELFEAKTAFIIDSLTKNAVVRPFLPRMRIVAIFDPEKAETTDPEEIRARALCAEDPVDLIVLPRQRVYEARNGHYEVVEERILNYLRHYFELDRADVVFAVTASHTHTRSSAHYTVDREEDDPRTVPGFEFHLKDEEVRLRGYYWPHCQVPGMVAYSAWDDRLKTPVHEFAHAMSSTKHGIITDEYNDTLFYDPTKTIVINKRPARDRDEDGEITFNDIPDEFVIYTDVGHREHPHVFLTDKHRLMQAASKSFVPARHDVHVPCTMDRSDEVHAFDDLIRYFMTRRLEAKVAGQTNGEDHHG